MTPEAFATHWHGAQVRNIEHCREMLAGASAEVQTIKLADLISNTKSIVEHDPKFAEARMLLDVLVKGDASLRERLRCLIA